MLLSFLAGCGSSGTQPASTNSGPPTANVSLSDTSFNFGQTTVGTVLTQTVVKISNMGTTTLVMEPSITGSAGYSIVPAQSCGMQLPGNSSCFIVVTYLPTTVSAPAAQTATLNLNYGNAAAGSPATVSLTGISIAQRYAPGVLPAGTVTSTTNPQVALYTITPPAAANVTVNFGTTTAYGLTTFSVPTPSGGGPVSIEVAGMLANTTYHLSALVQYQNGTSVEDVDHTFTTGSLPNVGGAVQPGPFAPKLTATTPSIMTPQAGIELVNSYGTTAAGLYATDLNGNVIWTYPFQDQKSGTAITGVKMLPNGDMVMDFGVLSNLPLTTPTSSSAQVAIREIDLIGNAVRQITLAQMNTALAAAGFNVTLTDFHHDVEPLPNGHLLVMANTLKSVTLTGASSPTTVLGDVVIDLDPNWNPVWIWNEFDHLDVNRHPYMFPDWTHSNAIIYSSDDGNFVVSIRHQNWLVKVNYANGTGDGSIIWRLGEGGDFTLMNNGAVDTNPADWFYAQHGPSFVGTSNAGIFNLILMDNGDDREFAAGVTCGAAGAPACLYSTVPEMHLNESTMTANLIFHQILSPTLYNNFGGNAEVLQNSNVEYDLCGVGSNADVFEVTPNSHAQTVWQLQSEGTNLYRAFRVPSLYPGVQW